MTKLTMPQGEVTLLPSKEIPWEYLEVMKQNNLAEDDLPHKIGKKINTFRMQAGIYDKAPSQSKYESLKIQSITIADEIQNFVERGFPEASVEPLVDTPPAGTPPPVTPSPATPPVVTPPAANEKQQWEAIKAYLDKEGRIYVDDLKQVLGAKRLADVLTVDGNVLERSFSFYYLNK